MTCSDRSVVIGETWQMIVPISSVHEADVADRFWFLEGQNSGTGDYFRTCNIADIESLGFYGGIHKKPYSYHRMLSVRFTFAISDRVDKEMETVVGLNGYGEFLIAAKEHKVRENRITKNDLLMNAVQTGLLFLCSLRLSIRMNGLQTVDAASNAR